MRRHLVIAVGIGAAALIACVVAFWPTSPNALAQDPNEPAGGVPPSHLPTTPLPIRQVVLYSSGVGYFQREGEVNGEARIDLSFRVENINDLLKSLVLRDLGGGTITAVSYDSQDPVEKTLRSFAIDLTRNPGFGDLLNQARGERVEVVMQTSQVTQPGNITGTIVGVEKKVKKIKEQTVAAEVLNLWCADGMRPIPLADVQRVRFLNPALDQEIRRALEVLALAHDTRKKTVSLTFSGRGTRPVRVGYVVECPIWKTSYRLVVNDDGKPFLQGWAIVENTSDDDWSNVRMALVSGRPISFQMDLYQPLYIKRPVVEPELFASLRPPTYSGAMEEGKAMGPGGGGAALRSLTRARRKNARAEKAAADRRIAGGGDAWGGRPSAPKANGQMDLAKGVASAATAQQLGDYFQYVIDQPVTLPRQKSALLPIVNQEVEGKRVSIYNQNVHAKFPLLGLKFKNTTGLHLMQGPITVFEGQSYAGDGRIQDLQPGEERLISYAIDLGTEVEPIVKQEPMRLMTVKIFKGIVQATNKIREQKTYRVRNRSDKDRLLIIEHPYRQQFRLVSKTQPAERSRDVYRFEMKVAARQSAQLQVVEERDLMQQFTLSNMNDQSIRYLMRSTVLSEQVRQALAKAVELRSRLAQTQRQIADRNRDLKELERDQARLRANLKELPPTAAAYKRYLAKFDAQENEIEKLQAALKDLRLAEARQRKEYEDYLQNLNVQ